MQTNLTNTLAPFGDQEFQTFAGVESENPLIGFTEQYAIVVDGARIQVIGGDEMEDSYGLETPTPRCGEIIGQAFLNALTEAQPVEDPHFRTLLLEFGFQTL